MLRDESNPNSTNEWTPNDHAYDWRQVDRTLRGLAIERARLDAEEARWLRVADKIQIWREVGCVSLLEYLERRLGYAPRCAARCSRRPATAARSSRSR